MRVIGRSESTSLHPEKNKPMEILSVTVRLQPVFGGDDDAENKSWSKHTPSGELQLSITNADAYNQFLLGKTYFIDITSAE